MAGKAEVPFIPRMTLIAETKEIKEKFIQLSPWLDEESTEIMNSNLAILDQRLSHHNPFVERTYELYSKAVNDFFQLTTWGPKDKNILVLTEAQTDGAAKGTDFLVTLEELIIHPNLALMELVVAKLRSFIEAVRILPPYEGFVGDPALANDNQLDYLLALVIMDEILPREGAKIVPMV